MSTILIKNGWIVGKGIRDILIRDNLIEKVEVDITVEPEADSRVIDAENKYLYPGLVNTHHHLTQSLAKAMPSGINCDLNAWLPAVPFALFDKLDAEIVYYSALMGLYELIRSGCTTCADHFYIYHRDVDMEIEHALLQAAEDMGVRFVFCRGGATHTGSHKGLRSTNLESEDVDLYLRRLESSLASHHQAQPDAMLKLVAAPTTIVHSSPPEDLVRISAFARENVLRMHTHLLEVAFDEEMAQERYGMPAIDYAESCGWLGDDVWFAHLVQADSYTIDKLAKNKTGIAHCPTSNCRLGSGIARVPEMAKKGVPVSIGVDGSASSESASMINEMMLTWLVHRAANGPQTTDAAEVLDWASKSGAEVLGYENLGEIAPGQLADLSIINLDHARFDGVWMKEYAPVLCGEPCEVETVIINGRQVFSDGQPTHIDMEETRSKAQACVKKLMRSLS